MKLYPFQEKAVEFLKGLSGGRKVKEVHTVAVAFCARSWKVFHTERQALDWIYDKEQSGKLWSVTPGTLSFAAPGQGRAEHEDD